MTVIFINPNSTVSMTEAAVAQARAAVPWLPVAGWTSEKGPPAIQGAADGAAAVPPLLELVREADAQGARAIVIACFDDTGLAEARALVSCPVIGIGLAGCGAAGLLAERWSVLTTLPVSVPVIDANIRAYGLHHRLGRVRPTGIPVLAIEADPEAALDRIVAEARAAAEEDGAGAVVLGCAGMAPLAAEIRAATGLVVVDGVVAAAHLAALAAPA